MWPVRMRQAAAHAGSRVRGLGVGGGVAAKEALEGALAALTADEGDDVRQQVLAVHLVVAGAHVHGARDLLLLADYEDVVELRQLRLADLQAPPASHRSPAHTHHAIPSHNAPRQIPGVSLRVCHSRPAHAMSPSSLCVAFLATLSEPSDTVHDGRVSMRKSNP